MTLAERFESEALFCSACHRHFPSRGSLSK